MVTDLLRSRPVLGGGGDLLPNYWNPSRGQPDIILPTATTAGVAVAFGLGAWGAWTQVQAAVPSDVVPVCVYLAKWATASANFWVEVGVGAAGAEVPLARVGGATMISGVGSNPLLLLTLRVAPFLVAAGSRVAARGWITAGNPASNLNVACVAPLPVATWYTPWPNTYIGGGRVTGMTRAPAVAGWVAVAGGGVAWTQVLAAAATDLVATAVEWDVSSTGGGPAGNRVEVGVGAPGAEVVFSRVAFPSAAGAWPMGYMELGRKSLVLAGERVAARAMGAAAGPWNMAFYFEHL